MNDDDAPGRAGEHPPGPRVRVVKNGPYLVTGGPPLGTDIIVSGQFGHGLRWERGPDFPQQEAYALCRCGRTKTPPFCDRAHASHDWDGNETASRESYLSRAAVIDGPALTLLDVRELCADARFCNRNGGTWNLTQRSDITKFRETAVTEAAQCPAGRLVARDKETGEPLEPALTPAIGVVEDPFTETSGPLWLKGGIPVESADGSLYEVRNRVTLCRCGESKNKPFCDGRHVTAKFNDGRVPPLA
jgi:CDGSH-type Zn-finger protein